MPEVLETEIRKHAGALAVLHAERLDESASILDKLGVRQWDQPPIDTARTREAGEMRLNWLSPFLAPIPLTLDQVRRALARVNAELPPNGPKNQQFKDSLIWEAIVDASSNHSPIFVTGDKGFFENRDPKQGVAASIRTEAETTGIVVQYTGEIHNILSALTEGLPPVRARELKQALLTSLMPRIEEFGRRTGVHLAEQEEFDVETYLTDNSTELAVEFRLAYRAFAGRERKSAVPGHYAMEGGCIYSYDTRAVSQLSVYVQRVWLDSPTHKDLESITFSLDEPDTNLYQGPRLSLSES